MQPEMTDRDTFASAALTGLLARRDCYDHEIAVLAWDMADAMLCERERTNHDAAPAARASLPTADHAVCRGRESGCGTGGTPAIDRLREWERHGSGRWGLGAAGDVTMLERRLAMVEAIVHDVAQAARARVDAAGISRQGTGKQTAPPCVETHGLTPDSRTGPINRTPECESPRRECGESLRRDVTHPDTKGRAAGGPAHNTQEPVAWGVMPGDNLPLWRCSSRRQAEAVVVWLREQRPASTPQAVPLVDGRQPQPTLTDAEREAIQAAAVVMDARNRLGGPVMFRGSERAAALRGLLERMGGGK